MSATTENLQSPVTKKPAASCVFCGFERTNGAMLSAAPDLLAALKDLIPDFEHEMRRYLQSSDPSPCVIETYDAMAAKLNAAVSAIAIAKAEGRA